MQRILLHYGALPRFSALSTLEGRSLSVDLSVGAADYDNDGWPDLLVANDGLPVYLYRNLHNGKFRENGETAGMAFTIRGQAMAAMCISLGDYDNDVWLDLYISDFQKSSDHLWHNSGMGYFDEVSDEAGITVPTRDVLSFGGGFFNYDNDGWLDLFIANGHVYPEIEQVSPEHTTNNTTHCSTTRAAENSRRLRARRLERSGGSRGPRRRFRRLR
jgi:FG-GAP-like repeat